jgi:vesicle-fusing ATPase
LCLSSSPSPSPSPSPSLSLPLPLSLSPSFPLHSEHSAVAKGTIALNGLQRTGAGVQPGDSVKLAPWSYAPNGATKLVAGLSVTFNLLTKVSATVSADDLAEFLKSEFDGHVFASGQKFACNFQSKVPMSIAVNRVSTLNAENKDDALDMIAIKSGLFKSGVKPEIDILAAQNPYLEFKKSATNSKSGLVTGNWNLSELGIGGLQAEFTDIFRRAFASRLYPQKLVSEMKVKQCKGMLLYGPPGTGKTLIARKLGELLGAREPKVVNGPEVLNKYVGATEEKIRDLFKDAEEDQAANGEDADLHIIIFDEIDSICKARGSTTGGTGVQDSIVNQLLSKIDGVNSINNILIIGMTNRKDLIDDALLRPGRLELHVEIGLPDESGRKDIFEIHTRSMRETGHLDGDVDFDMLAALTKNYSGAEIEGVVRSAQSFVLNSYLDPKTGNFKPGFTATNVADLVKVGMDHFMQALGECKPSFGVEEELATRVRGSLIEYGPRFSKVSETIDALIDQVRSSQTTPLMSVVLRGPVGAGKTAIAAHKALNSEFPFVKVISPEAFVGFSEHRKLQKINSIFHDAYKSPQSIVILDNIERLLEYVPSTPTRFSNALLQALMILIQKEPRNTKHSSRLLIMGTCSDGRMLEELGLDRLFNVVIDVPQLRTKAELRCVFDKFRHIGPGSDEKYSSQEANQNTIQFSDTDLDKLASTFPFPVSIKHSLLLIEMVRQRDGANLTLPTFTRCMEELGLLESSSIHMIT